MKQIEENKVSNFKCLGDYQDPSPESIEMSEHDLDDVAEEQPLLSIR